MIGSIVSKEVRSGGNIVNFDVDHSNFSKTAPRVITKDSMIGRTVVLTDWGFSEGNRVLNLSNVFVSSEDFEILRGMEEDNTNTFYFCYGDDIWNVVIQNLNESWNGLKYIISFTLAVISRVE